MPESLLLTTFSGEPQFERLPVLKLCCDESTPPNDRIFAQAQLCRSETHLFTRIWTFESAPSPDTLLSAQFSANGHLLAATVSLDSTAALVADGRAVSGAMTSYLFSGEDLQGVYAGAQTAIPLEIFFDTLAVKPSESATVKIGVNLLRVGSFVSSLAPVGSFVPLIL